MKRYAHRVLLRCGDENKNQRRLAQGGAPETTSSAAEGGCGETISGSRACVSHLSLHRKRESSVKEFGRQLKNNSKK